MNPTALLAGAIQGVLFTAIAYAFSRYTRRILVAVLIVAALIYVLFAMLAGASLAWLAAELVGVAVYGALAMRSLRGSAWWLVAGWALHPVWDVALHYVGPGHAFAPESYTVPCLTWDLAVAAIVAYRIVRGLEAAAAPAGTLEVGRASIPDSRFPTLSARSMSRPFSVLWRRGRWRACPPHA